MMKGQGFWILFCLSATAVFADGIRYIPKTTIPYTSATQSSEATNFRPATLALDGEVNTISHTGVQDNPWWRIEFGTTVNVRAVEIWNRNDCCYHQMSDLQITVDGADCGYYQGPLGAGKSTVVTCSQVLPGNTLEIKRVRLNDVLNIAEVTVYGSIQYVPKTTIPYTSATQSSESTNFRPATLALDGDVNTISHTGVQDNPWWRIEFGTTVNVRAVEIWNRNDCCYHQMSDLQITVDGADCGYFQGHLGAGKSTVVACSEVLLGNTLEIKRLRLNDVLNIAEVTVYAACPPPEDAQHASVSPGSPTYNPNDIVTYTCDECYEMTGDATRTCSEVGVWTGTPPVCSAINQYIPNSLIHYKSVTQSSEHLANPRPASLAVDGDTNTISHTGIQDNAWWKIEFCSTVNVSSVEIVNRHDCCWYQMSNLEITVDGVLCNRFRGPLSLGARTHVVCDQVLPGNTLQIKRLKMNDVLNLAEVNVIAG